ncbi:MAG: J domain-containing protein [Pseudomonadota bacterium]
MPKISLKPNSAEFAKREKKNKPQTCEMPGCSEKAEHKAPKHRGLNEYHEFCLEHVREYNKAWNFFDGMSNKEVEDHMISSLYGDRPTWRYDSDGAAESILRTKAWQTYHFTQKKPREEKTYRQGGEEHAYQTDHRRNTPEFEAMAIMGLEPPLDLKVIRKKYKELAKKHHPDLNPGCDKSEELLKRINMAYTILKMAFDKFEKLPERT